MTKVAALYGSWSLVCVGRFLYVDGGFVLAGNSFISLTAISVEKCFALHFHLRYNELITVKGVLIWIVSVWFCCLGSLSVFLLTRGNEFAIIINTTGVVGFVVNVIVYCSIFKTVKRHENQIQSQLQAAQHLRNSDDNLNVKKLGKSAKTIFFVYNLFLLCFSPSVGVMIAYTMYNFSTGVKMAINISSTLSFINAALNPGIYIWKVQGIRRAIKEMITFTNILQCICLQIQKQ